MEQRKTVVLIGLIPELVDFSSMPEMNAEKVRAGIAAQEGKLEAAGYDAHHLLVDLGETAESAIRSMLAEREYAADHHRRRASCAAPILGPLREGDQSRARGGTTLENLFQHESRRLARSRPQVGLSAC